MRPVVEKSRPHRDRTCNDNDLSEEHRSSIDIMCGPREVVLTGGLWECWKTKGRDLPWARTGPQGKRNRPAQRHRGWPSHPRECVRTLVIL